MFNKTILIVVHSGFVSRALLRSDFLSLIKKKFKKVILLVPNAKIEYYRKCFEKDNVVIDNIIPTEDSFLKEKFFTLLKFSIPTKGCKLKLMRNLFWRQGFRLTIWVVYFVPIFISWYLSRFKFWRIFLRKIYSFVRPNKECLAILQKHKVDVIFVNYTSLLPDSFSLQLIKAAKRLNIFTIGNIETWDNLDSKVFITDQTDFLTVPNQIVKKEAINIGDFREEKIQIVGLPCFDFYSRKEELFLSRKDFFQQIGADPKKKLILFATTLRSFGVDYDYFFNYLAQIANDDLKDVQFYLRPHPKYYFNERVVEKYKNIPGLIFEKKSDYFSGKNFELTEKDNQLLFNLFFHCHIAICFFSTVLIESCLMNKPIINVGYYRNLGVRYYYQPERDMERGHLTQIFKRNFAKFVKNDKELLRDIKLYLDNPKQDSQARVETAREQVFLTNGKAACRLADAVEEIAENNG